MKLFENIIKYYDFYLWTEYSVTLDLCYDMVAIKMDIAKLI